MEIRHIHEVMPITAREDIDLFAAFDESQTRKV
jgi:hypothetical protein